MVQQIFRDRKQQEDEIQLQGTDTAVFVTCKKTTWSSLTMELTFYWTEKEES